MSQARRRKSPGGKRGGAGGGGHGLGMLLAGMVIGGIGTALWMGARSGDATQIGSGIRQIMEISKRKESGTTTPAENLQEGNQEPVPQQTSYDFYTVLPEIETVITAPEPEARPPKKEAPPAAAIARVEERPLRPQPVETKPRPKPRSSFYMLQAGSFSNPADADRLKARLAMQGMQARIQKVTIHGRGNFYRVRLGPYQDKASLAEANRRLSRQGIRAITLKVSRGG